MSASTSDQKKRPPPIAIPAWPPEPKQSNAPPRKTADGQHAQRFASTSTQQGVRSGGTTPLTSPLKENHARVAVSGSGSHSSRHRSPTLTTVPGLLDQARASPRKSDRGSLPSQHGSTARSRQSERSYRSATAAQARLEALGEDEATSRSQIEARYERKLFKMSGQIPPTPTTGALDPDRVFIRTEDLRAQCRAASRDRQSQYEEPTKSPKKKLFGVSLPSFSRGPAISVAPDMPSKAAQILGASSSTGPRRIQPRPIKSAQVSRMPSNISKADASKSLPAKVDGKHHTKPHRPDTTGVDRMSERRSPGKENSPPHGHPTVDSSLDSMSPPIPPAKDTPPQLRLPANPPSPLRRAASHDDLRESYGMLPDKGTQVQLPFPMFALSPSPPKTAIQGTGGESPTKFRPYTAEDYSKLIHGEALQWPHSIGKAVGEATDNHSAPLAADTYSQQSPPQSSRSDDNHYNERLGRRLSPLPPRFYSPSDRSLQLFKDGESPSQNTDTNRMLFTPPNRNLLQFRENSNNGSIEIVYRGSMEGIEAMSVVSDTRRDGLRTSTPQHTAPEHASSQMQSARSRSCPNNNNDSGTRLESAQSSEPIPHNADDSTRCNPLNVPRRSEMGEPKCTIETTSFPGLHQPSTGPRGPSLHHSGPLLRELSCRPWVDAPMSSRGNGASLGTPFSPLNRTIDDHFFMTNEHLDVVGKTTYDAIEMHTKQQIAVTTAKHEQLVATLQQQFEDLKAQLISSNERVDHNANQTRSIGNKLGQFEKFLKDELISALTEQSRKTAELETSLKAIQTGMAHMQQSLEKMSEFKPTPHQSAADTLAIQAASGLIPQTAHTQHSQPALNTYYGAEGSREEQAPMSHLQDHTVSSNYDPHANSRGNYGNNSNNWHSQTWNGRSNWQGRHRGEASSYGGTNPYHFGNGSQYNAGYMNNYSSYNHTPATPEQRYTYGQKST